jgi:CubicO group peptidase (beta-lactamase class C family)
MIMDASNITRRRFGTLAMGSSLWTLTAGCAPVLARIGALPPGVGPVASAHAYRDGLTRSTPEIEGVSSDAILAFLADVAGAGLELHSLMLMRNEKVVAEGWWWPYQPDRVHITHSLTKSVTAAAVGLAIDDGRFGLDEKIVSFFPEYVPADASENMRAMTVRNLLTMQCGHDKETSGSAWRPISTPWAAEFFKIPVPHVPGTHFKYTSAASFMLSAIISKTTGASMADYLAPRFMEPLGIDRWRWDSSPGGVSPGGNGLSWNTSASLKLGAVHASGGLWNGNRILSEQWVRAATTEQTPGDADGAYGYQWWMGPGKAYLALGLFSQFTIVFPEHNAVLAIFSAIDGSKKIKPFIWKHFPAAFGVPSRPGAAAAELKSQTAALRLLPPLKPSTSPTAARVSGRRFAAEANDQGVEWLSFDFADGACTYRLRDANGEHAVTAGFAEYLEQDSSMTGNRLHHEYRPPAQRVVAGARWTAPDTLEMTWQFVETAFRDTLVCTFTETGVAVDRSVNINSAETRLPLLNARIG